MLVFALVSLAGQGHARAETAVEPVVGQTETFHAVDWGADRDIRLAATVRLVGQHCILYVEKGYPVPPSFLDELASTFDQVVYPTLTSLMGPAPDPGIDGEHRIVILLYDFRDPQYQVQGMFLGEDMDPLGPSDPDSNRRDMFSLNLPAMLVDWEQAEATSAHELAHLLMFYRDYLLDPSPRREYEGEAATWLEEGIAKYAELATGYGDRANEQLRSFEQSPTKDLTSWSDLNSDYGASYAFVAYLVDRYGPGLIRELVDQPLDGIAGIDATLQARGVFDDFDSLFDDWVIANFLDGRPPSAPGWSYGPLTVAVEPKAAPWPLPWVGADRTPDYGAVYLDAQPSDAAVAIRAVIDGDQRAPLRAALISWDSAGVKIPEVTYIQLVPSTNGGAAAGPAGYDRHTLVVWAKRGTTSQTYGFHFSLAANRSDGVQFLDMGSDHRFYPYVSMLLERGVVSGKEVPPSSGLWYYQPDENVKRAQFAKMVVEAVGLHTQTVESIDAPSFPDVRPAYDDHGELLAYPFDYVEEAAAAGIVGGYADGWFRPWDPLKRIQLVRMILRAAAAAGHPFAPYQGSETVFADIPPSSPFYADAMTGYENGIMTGTVEGGVRRLNPGDPATRGQVAKMTANLLSGLESSGG